MRRLFIVLVVILVLLTSCTIHETSSDKSDYSFDELHQEIDLQPSLVKNVSLYFLSKDGEKLVVETREISFNQESKGEYDVINNLLMGPQDSHLLSFADDYKLDSVEMLNNLANIYIRCDKTDRNEKEDFILAMALTNTICDYSGVNYVNVMINENALSYNGFPVGVLTKNKNDINEELARQQQNVSNNEFNTALYYLDPSSKYIVPEVRTVKYSGNDYASDIIFELAKGPQEAYMYNASVESSLRTNRPTQISDNDVAGSDIISIDLNKSPLNFFEENNLSIAAICNSVSCFIPKVNGIRFSVNGYELNYVVYRRTQFKNIVGAEMSLYYPDDTDVLRQVSKTVPQSETGMPLYVIHELILGPAESNPNLKRAFPESASISDLNNAYFAGDTVVIDWNDSIVNKIEALSESDERLMVYSVVNSLTNLKNVRRVQFLVDGNRVKYFGGKINIMDPLLSNPGIVK